MAPIALGGPAHRRPDGRSAPPTVQHRRAHAHQISDDAFGRTPRRPRYRGLPTGGAFARRLAAGSPVHRRHPRVARSTHPLTRRPAPRSPAPRSSTRLPTRLDDRWSAGRRRAVLGRTVRAALDAWASTGAARGALAVRRTASPELPIRATLRRTSPRAGRASSSADLDRRPRRGGLRRSCRDAEGAGAGS